MYLPISWGIVTEKVILIVVLGLVIYAVLTFATKTLGGRKDSALQILKERYARGEISEEEFRRSREVLLMEITDRKNH